MLMKMHMESEPWNRKPGWSQLSLAVRMTVVIYSCLISTITAVYAINLQYFGLKSERTTFENNFNFIRKQSETDSLLLNPKDSNYRIVKGFAQRSEKGDYFGLTNKKPFRDTLNIPILWCKLELHHSYSKFQFACKSRLLQYTQRTE